jgi:hypothetical protein
MNQITKEQALTSNEFHYGTCTVKRVERWRRNGKTQVWKTRPDEWRIPVKYGLRNYNNIWHNSKSIYDWHAAEDCPLTKHVDYPHFPGDLYDCPACEVMPNNNLDKD